MRTNVSALLAARGGEEYAGEPVSQLEHALQSAAMAEAEGAGDALIAAALLHDIGHLMDDDPDALAASGHDGAHEDQGADWLVRWFGPEVTQPVRLHVPAKRWLCAMEPGYADALSPASRRSLALQGGAFSPAEAADWLTRPFAMQGLRLRRWDDAAKIPGAATPPLAYFLDIAERVQR